MGRLHKLDTEIELEVIQHQPSNSPSSLSCGGYSNHVYDSYSKEYYYGECSANIEQPEITSAHEHKEIMLFCNSISYTGSKHKEILCTDVDEPFLRPPLWEDITSSIQNIDPENAIMLGTLATQVKLETTDEHLLEPLASPLLSPLEIKTEKSHHHQHHQHHTHNHHITASLSGGSGAHALHHSTTPAAILAASNLPNQCNSNSENSNSSTNNNNNNNNNGYHLTTPTNYHQPPLQSNLNGYLGCTNGSGHISLHQHHHHHHHLHGTHNAMQNGSTGNNTNYYNNNNNSWQNHSQVSSIQNIIMCHIAARQLNIYYSICRIIFVYFRKFF